MDRTSLAFGSRRAGARPVGRWIARAGNAGDNGAKPAVRSGSTVEVMLALHARLRAGAGLADALLVARQATAHDPTLSATAASFTAMGV